MVRRRDYLKSYKNLGDSLSITTGGYEGLGKKTKICNVEEYFKNADVYYCELIIIPDGRIIPAEPSHSMVLDSLLTFLMPSGEPYKEFPLSPTWLVEERLFYTKAIQVWEESQMGFGEPTKQQKVTLDKLVEKGFIKPNSYSCFDEKKREYFISNKEEIHDKAVEFYWEHNNDPNHPFGDPFLDWLVDITS